MKPSEIRKAKKNFQKRQKVLVNSFNKLMDIGIYYDNYKTIVPPRCDVNFGYNGSMHEIRMKGTKYYLGRVWKIEIGGLLTWQTDRQLDHCYPGFKSLDAAAISIVINTCEDIADGNLDPKRILKVVELPF